MVSNVVVTPPLTPVGEMLQSMIYGSEPEVGADVGVGLGVGLVQLCCEVSVLLAQSTHAPVEFS